MSNTYGDVSRVTRRAQVVVATAVASKILSDPALPKDEAREKAMEVITNPAVIRATNVLLEGGEFPAARVR